MTTRAALLAATALLAGCELLADIPSSRPLAGDAGMDSEPLIPDAAPPQCAVEAECAAGQACVATACTACRVDADCESDACLPDGSCVAGSRIAYAAPTGADGPCSRAMPCSIETALAVADARDVVKLAPAVYDRGATLDVLRPTILVATGATLRANAGMTAMLIHVDGAPLTAVGLRAEGAQQGGIACFRGGAVRLHRTELTGGIYGVYGGTCAVDLDRSAVRGALYYGVYVLGGPATVTNSYLVGNGTLDRSLAGLLLIDVTAATIDHTTIAGNTSTAASAVQCSAGSTAVSIRNSILYGNSAPAFDSVCNIGFSVLDPGYAGPGTNNVQTDPQFVGRAVGNFHLAPTSPVRAMADPASTAGLDYDGEPRPQPAGSARDPGADEVP